MINDTRTAPDFQEIDHRHTIKAIKQTYGPRYYIQTQALWEAAALWGITPEAGLINDSGVFLQQEILLQLHVANFHITIKGVLTPSQLWLMSLNYQNSLQGHGYACSVWRGIAYPTREDACLAGIHELLELFNAKAANGCSSESNALRNERAQIIQLLETEKTPQLTLF